MMIFEYFYKRFLIQFFFLFSAILKKNEKTKTFGKELNFDIIMTRWLQNKSMIFLNRKWNWVQERERRRGGLVLFLFVGIKVGTIILVWDPGGVVDCKNCSSRSTGNCIT